VNIIFKPAENYDDIFLVQTENSGIISDVESIIGQEYHRELRRYRRDISAKRARVHVAVVSAICF
jgi:hypothetical protein